MNKKLFKNSFFLIICFGYITVFAQQQMKHELKHFVDENERLYWNKKLPVYLRISSSPNDTGYVLKSEKFQKYTNPYYFDTEGINRIRTRYATDQSTGKAIYPETEIIWEIYADGIAPESKLIIQNPDKQTIGNQTYFGNNLLIEIKSSDATSGIETIYYSVNQKEYKVYTQPFNLTSEGLQKLSYYAVDKVGNSETPKSMTLNTDLSPPKTYYTITGISNGEIIASTTKILLSAEDSLSGVKTIFYKMNNNPFQVYQPKTYIPVSNLPDGEHTLTFFSVDKVGNKEAETIFKFYMDKTAPIVAADILGDRYLMDDKIFFSGRSKMKLTAIDNKAGVEDIYYSVNGEKFLKFDQPFYLPSVPGVHVVKYFATDKMQNNSEAATSKYEQYKHVVSRIYVDLSGPILNYEIEGEKYKLGDTLFINPNTKIKFSAIDKESGQQYISYSINSDPDETKYTEPLQFAETGIKRIAYYGYDNVNNRNRGDLTVFVDSEGPEIKYNFSITPKGMINEFELFPTHVSLFLGATDHVVGTKEIYFSLNGEPDKKYINSIAGFKKSSLNEVKIIAYDYLKNKTEQMVKFYVE